MRVCINMHSQYRRWLTGTDVQYRQTGRRNYKREHYYIHTWTEGGLGHEEGLRTKWTVWLRYYYLAGCPMYSCIEKVEDFQYLWTTLTNKNSIQEEIKSRLKVGYACYYSVQNLLSSSFLSKKLKIKIYRTIILPVVLYGCESWSRTLREERRLRVFENRVLRRVFEPKRDEVTGEWRKLHNEELSDLYSLPNIVRVVKSRRMG